jgi:Fe-S cluster assembly protein SufD
VLNVGESAQASIIECYGGQTGTYLHNSVTELTVDANATVDHYRLQKEGVESFHFGNLRVRLAADCTYTSHAYSLGAWLGRNDFILTLNGRGITATLNGLYLARDRQHIDYHTVIDHAQPHCNSFERYKGILDGRATGVFNGKIFVRKDAQKTDAKESNKNLILSDEAIINTKPQLEIWADDVKCTHGATIGQLGKDTLFYLLQRGLPQARSLLTYAFANEVIEHCRVLVRPDGRDLTSGSRRVPTTAAFRGRRMSTARASNLRP